MWDTLREEDIPSGRALAVAGELERGQLVWFNETFWFKDVAKSYREGNADRAQLHLKLTAGEKQVSIRGRFNAARVTSDSSLSNLSRQYHAFVAAFVRDVTQNEVTIRPVVIADRGKNVAGGMSELRNDLRVWPRSVDAFKDVDFSARLSKEDLRILRDVPEEAVKVALLDILGEPEHMKDWGGEQCDIWTDRITIDGGRHQAAFALKGPAKFHPMTVSDLGKNGDQIARLAHTAADLLVVQHCHTIKPEVIEMLRTYAMKPGHVRRYMALDGYDTLRILKHFGKV
ncbi:hypothetical protein [Gordonia paraffinivorans]|uniref:hypothetical protein n=1 Tax=Gordonia paraffinivorans TaxID=175628 RepID=UPI0011B27281|nr:hypothetical protein [Gordonia paraffinivorans]